MLNLIKKGEKLASHTDNHHGHPVASHRAADGHHRRRGGGVYVVVIMLFLHQDVKTAVGTALVLSTVTLSSVAWQYIRKKQVRWDYSFALSAVGIAGALAGSLLMRYIDEEALKIAILCIFALSVFI
jgi:uncharacterized membrane protein YfcA